MAEAQPAGPVRVNMDPDAECPQINVPLGQSSYSSFAGESSPANYRFQARISEFARQCILNPGNTITVRIGVQGLVILGEKGSPGTYPAPLRIAIRDRDGNTIWTASQKPSVTIPAGATQASFRIVDDTAIIPISLEKPLHTYEIEVGFVQGGTPTAKRKRG
jgi:hypothetical protein